MTFTQTFNKPIFLFFLIKKNILLTKYDHADCCIHGDM